MIFMFATACCVLMVVYWTLLLFALYSTRNQCYDGGGANESMQDNTKQNTDRTLDPGLRWGRINEVEDRVEGEVDCEVESEVECEVECETKKEN